VKGGLKKSAGVVKFGEVKNMSVFTIRILNDINWFYTLFAALQRAGFYTPPF
jgi:hypothetical protein